MKIFFFPYPKKKLLPTPYISPTITNLLCLSLGIVLIEKGLSLNQDDFNIITNVLGFNS